jgi:hypothetical protein
MLGGGNPNGLSDFDREKQAEVREDEPPTFEKEGCRAEGCRVFQGLTEPPMDGWESSSIDLSLHDAPHSLYARRLHVHGWRSWRSASGGCTCWTGRSSNCEVPKSQKEGRSRPTCRRQTRKTIGPAWRTRCRVAITTTDPVSSP